MAGGKTTSGGVGKGAASAPFLDGRGVTLIELLVVISVIGVLIVALGFSFRGWIGKYRVESQIKQMHADIMNARARAMQVGRTYMVTAAGDTYQIYDDANGNGAVDAGDDLWLATQTNYTILSTVPFPLDLSGNGIVSASGGLALVYNMADEPDYDCLDISSTRVNLGKWDVAANECESK